MNTLHFQDLYVEKRVSMRRGSSCSNVLWPVDETDRCVIIHGVEHLHDVVPVQERGHDHGSNTFTNTFTNTITITITITNAITACY